MHQSGGGSCIGDIKVNSRHLQIPVVMSHLDAMKSTMPSDQQSDWMQTIGKVVCCLAISSLLAVLLCAMMFFAVLSSDSGANGPIAQLGRGLAPYLGFVALATLTLELLTIGMLAMGAVCWQFSIVRSPRWIVSGACTVVATLTTVALILLYVVIATSNV
jgi:hypothetical protein